MKVDCEMQKQKLHVWKAQHVDGGKLYFDANTGTNVLLRNEETQTYRRTAPRSLQIGLLSPCNLACSFCYRDAAAPSRLTSDFLIDLLIQADTWGVLEVAFGGGEPLLFRGFTQLLRTLRERTRLGLNFTTNGTLLTAERIAEFEGLVGEVLLSAYPDNKYRDTLRRARKLNIGVNYLVTPENVNRLELDVQDFLRLGARNVLLLGYKGADPALHLGAAQLETLAAAVRRMKALPLRLDICWYPHLADVDHLFERSDCEAGNEFLVITPDRAVQACSFSTEKFSFDSFAELQAIYRQLQTRKPAALISGCTRSLFRKVAAPQPTAAAWVWQARASNNSGDWTIAAKFCDVQTAQQAAQSLRELARAHEQFLASDEGQAFVEGNGYDGSIPTPTLKEFGRAHGFEWDEGLWWEEDGCGAPVLTAGVIGDTVVVYHPYCMGLQEAPFRELFRRTGGVSMGYWQYGRPGVVIRAVAGSVAAIEALQHYLRQIAAAKYAYKVTDAPPWGREARDPRLLEDEDRSARLADGQHHIAVSEANELVLQLAFENTFAGALAVEAWLTQQGFSDIRVSIEQRLDPIAPTDARVEPQLALWGNVMPGANPWAQTSLLTVPNEQVVEWMVDSGAVSEEFATRLKAMAPAELHQLLVTALAARLEAGGSVVAVLVGISGWLDGESAELVREFWGNRLPEAQRLQAAAALHFALPADEAYDRARQWIEAAGNFADAYRRLHALAVLREPRLLSFVEQFVLAGELQTADAFERLVELTTQISADYELLAKWIAGPTVVLARLGIRVLARYCKSGCPEGFQQIETATLTTLLNAYRAQERDAHQLNLVAYILENPIAIVNDSEAM
jgi:MoaA/NifB/PqqE/SkfB family radical SAM enzyme